jgi:hypothetical protein
MSPTPTLYRIQATAVAEQLALEQVFAQDGGAPLGGGYRQLIALTFGQASYLIAVQQTGSATAFELTATDPWLTPVQSALELGGPWDTIEPFQLGGATYLLAYASATGELAFVPIDAQLRSHVPYRFSRLRPPGPTAGFDVVQPIVVDNLTYVLCYSAKTGDVNAYSLTVTAAPAAGSPPGTPALLAAPVWVHQWARNWTRFAFFQLGGETFFLKTNTGKLNVNIDHVLDDPTQGTVEVGTYLQLEHALELDIVRAFHLGGGDPYFIAYMGNGSTTLYRFHADCQGWTPQASVQTVAKATQIVPLSIAGETYALFY